jgi:integrase
MNPRTVSVQVAHESDCPNAGKTSLKTIGRGSGCKCEPSYYTFQRLPNGKVQKGARVKDRKTAEQAANVARVELDQGRAGVARPKQVLFTAWADEYEEILRGRVRAGDMKPKTPRAYGETLALARLEFENVTLDEIGAPELRGFYGRFDTQAVASRLRHLRQLSACFTQAVDDGKLAANPLPPFIKKLKLKPPKRGKAPFEDDELTRLWAAYKPYEPVYGAAARFSAETGMRLGEVSALDWPNVDLTGGRVYVEHTWDDQDGVLVKPKDGEERYVYLTKEAREVLEAWVKVAGARDSGPVYPNPIGGGRLMPKQVQRRIGQAMQDAGIPKIHPGLRLPRSFHSLRYSTSNVMQRRGYHPRFIEQTLGHSTLELSYGTYGAWSPGQMIEEANRERD